MKNNFYYSLLIVFSTVILLSCSKSSSNSNIQNGALSWTLDFNGQSYSWSGTYPPVGTNDGEALYTVSSGTNPTGAMVLASPTNGGVRAQNISMSFASAQTGTFQMNESSYNQTTLIGNVFAINFGSSSLYSSQFPGSNITVNVTSLSPNSVANSGPTGAGTVTGNFNGVIRNAFGSSCPVSGTFTSIRVQ